MSTIPASVDVQILPNVVSAGGNALDLIGLVLTHNTRVPIGAVMSFASVAAVSAFFGASDPLVQIATVYFNGFNGSSVKPGAMLVAQYNSVAVSAYSQGGNAFAALTLAQLQALSGSLTVVVDGYTHTGGSINLSTATSFSAAAGLIQTGLSASEPTE